MPSAHSAETAHLLVFGKIHSIEWLSNTHPDMGTSERRTGKELYEELREMIAGGGVADASDLHRVSSHNAFLKCLKRIKEDCAASNSASPH